MMNRFNRNMELRKLPAAALSNIAHILEVNNDWQKVVPLIPRNIQSQEFERKYTCEQIDLMETYAKETKKMFAEVLFDEWGTSGIMRPTLGILMGILHRAGILRAVDEIARMIGEPPPPRPLEGPGAPITTSLTEIQNDESIEQRLNSIGTIPSVNLLNCSQDNAQNNRTTRQLKEPSNLIVFSKSVLHENTQAKPLHNGLQANTEISDMMKFSGQQSNAGEPSDYIPNITEMLPESVTFENSTISSIPTVSDSMDNTESNNTDTSSQNELSHFIPNSYSPSKSNMDIFGVIDMAILEDKQLLPFAYRELEAITDKFSETFVEKPTGPVGKIGCGGFGDVYVGVHKNHGALAVKRVRIPYHMTSDLEIVMKTFNTEVKSLSYLRHKNIVPIFGYSFDGPTPCLVCKYIDGGSLLQKIAAKVLTEQQRIDIILGTAEGLKYIHHSERPQQTGEVLSEIEIQSAKKCYFLHGDVKSANILLTKDCVPKLCDFGLAKHLDTTIITKSMMGTTAYMSPEGFSGTITQKNDIFSFGIVLLELITGLKPIVDIGGECLNIKSHVEEMCTDDNITRVLDRSVPKWTKAQKLYDLAKKCLDPVKDTRPSIDIVWNDLNEINSKNPEVFYAQV